MEIISLLQYNIKNLSLLQYVLNTVLYLQDLSLYRALGRSYLLIPTFLFPALGSLDIVLPCEYRIRV
jgi:hypothetical protein